MINFLSIIALGFFLGMRHATDPDHVIAVTTIVSREKRIWTSAWIGVFWGIGHTLTLFAIGTAIVVFDLVIPPRLGLSMELSVGVMLIVLGAINVLSFVRGLPAPEKQVPASDGKLGAEAVHSHIHAHGDYVHAHPHMHSPECHPHSEQQTPVARLDRMLLKFRPYRPIRPLIIGSAFRLISGGQFFRRLALASGLLSIGFGLLVAYQIVAVSGLLSANPHWIAH